VTATSDWGQALGDLLAEAFVTVGAELALFTYLGIHLCLLAVLLYVVVGRKKERAFRRFCELNYGLLNPLVYLIVLRPGFITYEFAFWQALPLQTIAWLLLAFVWALRLAGAPLTERPQFNRVRLAVLWTALACIVTFGMKDLLILRQVQPAIAGTPLGVSAVAFVAWLMSGLASLYLIPAVLVADFLRTEPKAPQAVPEFFLLRGTPARIVGFAVGAFTVVALVIAMWRPSDEAARRTTLAYHDEIIAAASEYGVDPAVIAAITYVTQRYQITPFRGTVERLAMTVWLWDTKSHFFLAPGLNISIGMTQIKPVTAQTALVLSLGGGLSRPGSKEYREVPLVRWSLPQDQIKRLDITWLRERGKADVVKALLDDRDNLRMCALILAVYQAQWETAPGAARIGARPDILATLFQIGFERSHPKSSPQSNAFGRQVQQTHNLLWLREAFR
jgi:hypothetical protein